MDTITISPGLHHILEKIFMELDQKELDNCQLVNKIWNNIITNKSLHWYEKLLEKSSLLSDEEKTKWKKLIGKLNKCAPNQIAYIKNTHFKDMHGNGWKSSVAEKIFTATLNRDVKFIKTIAPIAVNPNAVFSKSDIQPQSHFRTPYFDMTPIQAATLRSAAVKIGLSKKRRRLENPKCAKTMASIKAYYTAIEDPESVRKCLPGPECASPNDDEEMTNTEKLKYADIIRILAQYSYDNPNAPLLRSCCCCWCCPCMGDFMTKRYRAYFNSKRLGSKSDLKGWTPIQIASINGNAEIVEILAKFTKYPNAPIKKHCKLTMIQLAVETGYTDVIRALVPFTENPNEPYPDGSVSFENGYTPIQRATSFGNSEIVRILAPLAIKPNEPYPNGATPIQIAAKNGSVDIVKILIPLSENPNAPDPDGFTPIQTAAKHGHFEVIKILIPFSENPNAPDPYGFTPIQTASSFGYSEVVRILAPLCKNPNAPDPNDVTPLALAENNGFTKIKEILIPLHSLMDEEITDKQEDDELKHVLKRLKKF